MSAAFIRRLGGVAGVRVHGNTDTRRRINFAAADFVFLGQHEQELLRCRCRVARLTEIFQAYDKLVAAPAARKSPTRRLLFRRSATCQQQGVANIMAQRVVDRLEPVEVDEQGRERRLLPLAATDRAGELFGEQAPVCEPRQLVKLGELLEFEVRRCDSVMSRKVITPPMSSRLPS